MSKSMAKRERVQRGGQLTVTWICGECADTHGKSHVMTSTMHSGQCSMCGKWSALLPAGDYGIDAAGNYQGRRLS